MVSLRSVYSYEIDRLTFILYLDRIYPASLSKVSYAEARRIIRVYFGLVFLYPVHPACQGEAFSRSLVDPVRNMRSYYGPCQVPKYESE